jgi:site-specific DNA-methyltransferase (adenine-specific)
LSLVFYATLSKGAEKAHHPWEQGLDEAVHYLVALVSEGDLVCDPCLGGGTTGVASVRSGMGFVGCEIDPETYRQAKARIAGETRPMKTRGGSV